MQQDKPGDVDAVILAGGLGTRLKSVIGDRNKVLATVQGKPFLDIIVADLVGQGFGRIVLCVSHLREQVIAHFARRSEAEFLFSEEETPLGTGGAIRRVSRLIGSDPFLVLNGDSLCRIEYARFLAFHRKTGAAMSMVVAGARGRVDGGTVELASDGRIARFREKSPIRNVARTFINAGIYLMRRDLPASWHNTDPFSLERDIFPKLVNGKNCYGFVVDAEVVDIGTPERYVAAQSKL
jgi:D-glycero-alpha-D-manno-heptose 1-phosphate guanylyltransferase